jgi:ankyrin repeat protein
MIYFNSPHGRTPLHCGAFTGHLAVVQALLAAKSDVNAKDK